MLAGRPTVQTLALVGAVFCCQQITAAVGAGYTLFVLDATVLTRPWTLLTSVYAHATLGHLLANAVGLVLVGPLVARRTTVVRFHSFVLATGSLAGLAEVAIGGIVGPPHAVVGASGAVLALLGYLLGGNFVTAGVLDRVRLSARIQAALFVAVVVGLTLVTAGPGSALFGHAAGLVLGLLAGRRRLLDHG
jgi:membrane associated rhomboid family serine protease